MPTLPTYELRNQAPRTRYPEVQPGPGAYVARGLGQLSEGFDYVSRVQDVYEKSEARRLSSELLQSAKDGIALAEVESNDPDEFRERSNAALEQSAAGANNISNARIKGMVNESLAGALKSAKNVIEIGAVKKSRDKIKGNFVVEEKEFLAAAVAGDGNAIKEHSARVDELAAANVIEYTIAEKLKAEFPLKAQKERAFNLLEKSPNQLLKELESGGFELLPGQDRNTLKNHAEAAISEQKRLAKEVEKERLNTLNTKLLEREVAGKLTVAEIMAIPESELPFEQKKFWIDRKDAQIDEARRERREDERERKADIREARADAREARAARNDPFKTSDSAVLGQAMQGVLAGDEAWTRERVLGLMGKGLSVPHALQAFNLIAKGEKDPAGTLTPMKMAQNAWNTLQRSMAFVPGEELKTPEVIMRNSREAQKVWDEVSRRGNAGEDPRVVLEELMQPIYEQQTKGWFEQGTFTGALIGNRGYTADERTKARQLLVKGGKEVTEENINKIAEGLRNKPK